MRYFGGKFRIRANILEKLKQYKNIPRYIEPFCGMCWVGEFIPQKIRIFNDYNKYLIAMWKKVQEGWIPPSYVSEKQYKFCRDDPRVSDYMKGFVGFAGSWGGKFWGGYARGFKTDGVTPRNFVWNASNTLVRRIKNFEGAIFTNKKYSEVFKVLQQSKHDWLVYCDPPYENTGKYYGLPDFDHDLFWENVRRLSKKHVVITSSYEAPKDFKIILETQTKTDITLHDRIERLFGIGKAL
jgi:DNA adenine methylase